MKFSTVAIAAPGDMGHAVGRAVRELGHDVIICLKGRSDFSRERAVRAGLREVPDLETLVSDADLFLSILPPASAVEIAEQIAAAMKATGKTPVYADCNAIAPETVKKIGRIVGAAGADFIDGSIIGSPPGKPGNTRLYVSGPRAADMAELEGPEMRVLPCGTEIGHASAVKMCYASTTKAVNALYTAVLTAAETMGVGKELRDALADGQQDTLDRMARVVPFLPCDAERYIGEMEEIAETFAAAGVTPDFHRGAADIYRLLATTPFASETRESADRSRTLDQAVAVYAQHLPTPKKVA